VCRQSAGVVDLDQARGIAQARRLPHRINPQEARHQHGELMQQHLASPRYTTPASTRASVALMISLMPSFAKNVREREAL
jgi:hypothetical protein